jgi:hypothetical protein
MSVQQHDQNGPDVPIPDGFGYVVSHEAWYASAVKGEPEIMVGLYAGGGGCQWEFGVRQVGNIAIRAEVFSDAFAAFVEVPEFFRSLPGLVTLTEVRELLDELGAVDRTERTAPKRYRAPVGGDLCWDRGPRVGEGVVYCVLNRGHGDRHQAHHSFGQVEW